MAVSSTPSSPGRRKSRRWLKGCVLFVLVAATLLAVFYFVKIRGRAPVGEIFREARIALINGDYSRARELASRIPEQHERYRQAQLLAGEAATHLEDYPAALAHYSEIPRDGSPLAVQAALARGEIHRTEGELSRAEYEYQFVVKHDPGNVAVHERLAFLQSLSRRLWEARPHYLALLHNGKWTLKNLAILSDLERPLDLVEYLNRCARHAPDDLVVQMGLAATALYREGDSDLARGILQNVVAEAPERLTAQAMLGESLLNLDEREFLNWHSRLPPHADENPDIWYTRGLWARRKGKLEYAARCFWETVRKVPVHRRGNYQLAQVLEMLEHPAAAEFAALANRQFQMTQHLDDVLSDEGKNEKALQEIVETMEQTGRFWEGCAWARTAAGYYPESTWPRLAFTRMERLLEKDPEAIVGGALALKHDLSHFPSSNQDLSEHRFRMQVQSNRSAPPKIRFEQAMDAGPDFVYFNGDDPSTPGVRMFEQAGGGVAVLDLDSDGWPDLYFTQGAKWIHGENAPIESPQSADQIFRNIEGKRFVNVTALAGLGNRGFGQGASVGDFNGDGFSDLYVANVGLNRLYQNNGDGTFRDVTQESGLHLTDWTSSCIVVDLNADGLSDLFDVNYLTGDEVYSRVCLKKGCSPGVFDGLPDRLQINRGDGTFKWVEGATPESNAKGLGVVAADLFERGRPCLFVANDQVPNHFLRNSPSSNSINIELEDQAFLIGLSHDVNGLATACMGITVDDVNNDGLLDFFVTNFKTEANTLYIQDLEGLFIDQTHLSGLYSPSLPMTGWGTQFLDADLDGAPDLIVANGHVYPEAETEYRMRAQFFRNDGEGHFAEIPPKELGSYFEKKHAGRSLARLDWNRDGLMDFAVLNINEPAALLTNRTATNGHFLAVRLRATTTARDAIGSVVEVEAGGRRWTKQLVAGDGYQASNERMLHFGLGANDVVSSISVTWPSGRMTKVKNLPADGRLELVEGTVATYTRGGHSESIAVEHLMPSE